MLQPIPAGFSRPVFESQSTFRVTLQAMSRPGRPVRMPVSAAGPAGWSGCMAALVLTLCDVDTPLWLAPGADEPEALRFLRFHCGSPVVASPADAAFAVVPQGAAMPSLAEFAAGSAEYPEKSATVFIASPLAAGAGPDLRVSGPGVDGEGALPRSWLPEGFLEEWEANRLLFPRGVDVILVGREAVVGLPRTVKMEARPCM